MITIDIVAQVTGSDTTTSGATEGFLYGWGSVVSAGATGAVAGNLSTATLSSPYNAGGSQGGTTGVDLNSGSGGLDVGSGSFQQNANFIYARAQHLQSGSLANATSEFLLGTISYTVTAADAASGLSTLSFLAPTFTNILQHAASIQVDGVSETLNGGSITSVGVTFNTGSADAYYTGSQAVSGTGTWSTDNGTTSAVTNFVTTATGSVSAQTPGAATIVHFNATATTGAVNTDLGSKDVYIKGLDFISASSVTIGSTSSKILNIGASGITDSGAAAHSITAKVGLLTNQSWSVSSTNALTVSGVVSNALVNGVSVGSKSLSKDGAGKLILSGANTYTGATTVNNGILEIRGTDTLNNTSGVTVTKTTSGPGAPYQGTLMLTGTNVAGVLTGVTTTKGVTLAGGTLAIGSATSHSIGALTLTGNSTLDFDVEGTGVGNSTLTIASADAATWTSGNLTIENWNGRYNVPDQSFTGDHIIFTSTVGLDVSRIKFDRGGILFDSYIGANNELFAVPEPGAIGAALLLLGSIGWRERRRLTTAFGLPRLRQLQPSGLS